LCRVVLSRMSLAMRRRSGAVGAGEGTTPAAVRMLRSSDQSTAERTRQVRAALAMWALVSALRDPLTAHRCAYAWTARLVTSAWPKWVVWWHQVHKQTSRRNDWTRVVSS
jgi:hypothetical protein